MYIKLLIPIILVISLVLICGCTGDNMVESIPVNEGVDTLTGDYSELYGEYMAEDVDVTVTLSVDMGYAFENKFSLSEGGDGYTVTDLSSDEQYTYDAAKESEAYKAAGYLPPNEIAYPDGEGYSSRLSGDLALERLLSGSNVFDGYDAGCVTLDGECLYTAKAEDGITSYTYEFKVQVKDGEAEFPASIKYLIEVNK